MRFWPGASVAPLFFHGLFLVVAGSALGPSVRHPAGAVAVAAQFGVFAVMLAWGPAMAAARAGGRMEAALAESFGAGLAMGVRAAAAYLLVAGMGELLRDWIWVMGYRWGYPSPPAGAIAGGLLLAGVVANGAGGWMIRAAGVLTAVLLAAAVVRTAEVIPVRFSAPAGPYGRPAMFGIEWYEMAWLLAPLGLLFAALRRPGESEALPAVLREVALPLMAAGVAAAVAAGAGMSSPSMPGQPLVYLLVLGTLAGPVLVAGRGLRALVPVWIAGAAVIVIPLLPAATALRLRLTGVVCAASAALLAGVLAPGANAVWARAAGGAALLAGALAPHPSWAWVAGFALCWAIRQMPTMKARSMPIR